MVARTRSMCFKCQSARRTQRTDRAVPSRQLHARRRYHKVRRNPSQCRRPQRKADLAQIARRAGNRQSGATLIHRLAARVRLALRPRVHLGRLHGLMSAALFVWKLLTTRSLSSASVTRKDAARLCAIRAIVIPIALTNTGSCQILTKLIFRSHSVSLRNSQTYHEALTTCNSD